MTIWSVTLGSPRRWNCILGENPNLKTLILWQKYVSILQDKGIEERKLGRIPCGISTERMWLGRVVQDNILRTVEKQEHETNRQANESYVLLAGLYQISHVRLNRTLLDHSSVHCPRPHRSGYADQENLSFASAGRQPNPRLLRKPSVESGQARLPRPPLLQEQAA